LRQIFLNQYQKFLKNCNRFEPLVEEEIKYFKYFIIAANIFMLRWILSDYYNKTVDNNLYSRWLIHTIRLMRWLEKKNISSNLHKIVIDALKS